ncbi:MAG: SGNH/GDSL hydrolase family protein [Janthinobacterium lividum]
MALQRLLTSAALALATAVSLAPVAHAAAPVVPVVPRLDLPPHARVLLLGDSYTEGIGATPIKEGYAYKVAAPLGWTLTRDGLGTTGYVNPGKQNEGRYADRLWRHPADGYDAIFIQGSSNDQAYTSTEVKGAVNMTVRTVAVRYPHAKLVIVGLATPYGTPSADRARVNAVLKGYANEKGIRFFDPLGEQWFSPGDGDAYANPINGHPNNAGHLVMADRFTQDVRVS